MGTPALKKLRVRSQQKNKHTKKQLRTAQETGGKLEEGAVPEAEKGERYEKMVIGRRVRCGKIVSLYRLITNSGNLRKGQIEREESFP